jgi:hypothetical protein
MIMENKVITWVNECLKLEIKSFMSKIVFFCIPAHGHTNPTLGVVRDLTARGHEVYYYSYEMMRQKNRGDRCKICSL